MAYLEGDVRLRRVAWEWKGVVTWADRKILGKDLHGVLGGILGNAEVRNVKFNMNCYLVMVLICRLTSP